MGLKSLIRRGILRRGTDRDKGLRVLTRAPRASSGVSREGGGTRSPLVDVFPTFAWESVYFNRIDVPASTAIASPNAAWYGLRRLSIDRIRFPEGALVGLTYELLPCDVEGVGDGGSSANFIAWGDTKGIGAAIVIGFNLPCAVGVWSEGPSYFPGLVVDAANDGRLVTPDTPPNWLKIGFPTGKFSDASPSKVYGQLNFGAHLQRLPEGSRLDIALVVRPNVASPRGLGFSGALNAGVLCGMADLRLRFSDNITRANWSAE